MVRILATNRVLATNRILASGRVLATNRSSVSAPTAPTNFDAVGGISYVTLSWVASPGATSYNVRRSPAGANVWSTPSSGSGVATNSFIDTDLLPQTNDYEVQAVNSAGVSSWTSTVTASSWLVKENFSTFPNGTDLVTINPAVGTGPWTNWIGTIQIQNGYAQATTLSGTIAQYALPGPSTSSFMVESEIVANEITAAVGVVFGVKDSNNYLIAQFQINNSTVYLQKCVAGSYTLLGSGSHTFGAASAVNSVRVVVSGTSAQVYINGAAVTGASATGIFLPGNGVGIRAGSTSNVFHSFKCLSQGVAIYPLGVPLSTTVGSTLTVSQPILPGGGSPTVTFTGPESWTYSGGSYSFTPIFEDGGTAPRVTWKVTDGTYISFNSVLAPTFRSTPMRNAGNPQIALSSPYATVFQEYPQYSSIDKVGSTIYGVALQLNSTTQAYMRYTGTIASGTGNPTWVANGAQEAYTLASANGLVGALRGTVGPMQGGTYAGKYLRYVCSYLNSSGQCGIFLAWATSTSGPWTVVQTQIIYCGSSSIFAFSQVTSIEWDGVIYLYCTNSTRDVVLYTSPMTDGVNFTKYGIVISGGVVAGAILEDYYAYPNLAGFIDFTTTYLDLVSGVQYITEYLSADGINFSHNPTLPWFGPGGFDTALGDVSLDEIENFFNTYYGGGGGTGGDEACIAQTQSTTTSMFVGIATLTFTSGNTTYWNPGYMLKQSPNGYTAANMTAVPVSGTVGVYVTNYSSSDVLTTVSGTNGVSVAFTLNGMTASHVYTIKKNGTIIATPTASGTGVLTFSNSVWGTSDMVEVIF